MTQEALKLALEALEANDKLINGSGTSGGLVYCMDGYYSDCFDVDPINKQIDEAVAAIKEALAQPEQEPFGYFKAEPFGWTDCAESDVGAIALYPTPPQRTWVGLTRIELIKCGVLPYGMSYELYQAIEAKLKDKNS